MKRLLQFCFHPDSIITLFLFFFFWIILGWMFFQPNIHNHFPFTGPFQGNRKCIPLHVHFVVIQVSCPWSFCEVPLGLVWPVFAEWLKGNLAFDNGISFHHIHGVPPTLGTWGFSNYTLVCVKLSIVWCSGPWREERGLREKRNHILSISAENI